MPEPDKNKIKAFDCSAALHSWLQEHHANETELWVKIYKKGTGIPSVTWNDVVTTSLCWGWIDGIKKSLDSEAYLQRITPRKPGSNWSKINTEHVARLIAEGRMQAPGMVHVEAAKADGRWESAYAPASQMQVPEDFIIAVKAQPLVEEFYKTLPKSSRYAIAYGLCNAKRSETRQRRFDKFMTMLLNKEKPGFGFKS